MPPTCLRPISERFRRPGNGFTLIEAIVALAITALLALTAARLAASALERERLAREDAAVARAIQTLSARIPDANPGDRILLPDGWRAVPQQNRDLPDWQTWEIYGPDDLSARHLLHVPAPGKPARP